MSWKLPYNHKRQKLVKSNPLTWIPYFVQWLRTGKGTHNLTPLGELGLAALIMGHWLFYILFVGWFLYLFRPTMTILQAKDLDEWIGYCYNQFQCDMAEQARKFNDPEATVSIIIRQHPIFMDTEIMTIYSLGFNEKIRT